MVLLGPRLETKEKTVLYTEIESLFTERMRGCCPSKVLSVHFLNKDGKVVVPVRHGVTMKATKPPSGEPLAAGIADPFARKIDPVKLITSSIGGAAVTVLDQKFKQIVYDKIFSDSVCFGMFHYDQNNKSAASLYFESIYHPLSIAMVAISRGNSTEVKAHIRPGVLPILADKFTRIVSSDILSSIKLKDDFVPEYPRSINQPPGDKKKKQNKKKKNKSKKNKDKKAAAKGKKNGNSPPQAGKGKGKK
jgi:hypothetical protein